ncbi:MAG: hypothetical protein K9N47_01295 [Prosthecobacter sp.]|uniref:hypothetical protein n=1 Tax=Prosthecobacter sp. TaxID=1965333 RepID=UPI0025E04B39|nr:hypothetical protein [Prosthecobacter sp.]MCF7784721.1 hypothetical protein [Prosthecobacter sp.]
MHRLLSVLLIVFWVTTLFAKEEKQAVRLSRQEVKLLDDFLDLKPGLTEEELRERVQELSLSHMDKSAGKLTLATSTFRLAGVEWSGRLTLVHGKLQEAELQAFAWKERYPKTAEQVVPQYQMRGIGLLVAAHYTAKFGKVSEGYVPNIDCPAGNPFGLRQEWRLKDSALAVEFAKNSSTSSVRISLMDWTAWDKEQRETYSDWPLDPAPQRLLIEAISR